MLERDYSKNIHDCLIINRAELPGQSYEKKFNQIGLQSLTTSLSPILGAAVVLFVDKDGSTKILKSRYGMTGVVISEKQYEHYVQLLKKEAEEASQKMLQEIEMLNNENDKSDSGTKKKSFLERIFGKHAKAFNRS